MNGPSAIRFVVLILVWLCALPGCKPRDTSDGRQLAFSSVAPNTSMAVNAENAEARLMANTLSLPPETCPLPLTFDTTGRSLGRTVKVTYRLFNKGSRAVANAVVSIRLPQNFGPFTAKHSAFPTKRDLTLVNKGDTGAYWLGVTVLPQRKRTFTARLKTALCQPTTLRFGTAMYLVAPNGTAFCPSGVQTAQVTVQPKYVRGEHQCTTPSPTSASGADPFRLFAEGERCLEGGLAPFPLGGRRYRRDQSVLEPNCAEQQRTLQSVISTPYDCWYYCSVYGGVPAPFYFNWQVTTRQCYCCGSTCTLVYDPGFLVFEVTRAAEPVSTVQPTKAPTLAPTTAAPSVSPTFSPTAAPTRSCLPGEYRTNNGTGPCASCIAGTYWNSTQETTVCLACPANQTSLQRATRCYTPCPDISALNTTDLTCVPIPASVETLVANSTVNLNTSSVFTVEEATKLEDTIGAAAAATTNETTTTVIIALGPGLYPQSQSYQLTVNVIIIFDPALSSSGGGRRLQAVTLVDAIIYAIANSRHYIMANALIATDGVVFQGGRDAGGIVLADGATGVFYNTTFRHCHAPGNGGGLFLTNGSAATVDVGSVFIDNAAVAGGAIYASTGCRVQLNDGIRFQNNSAPRTATGGGGGGAIYLQGAPALVGSNVAFFGNHEDDITSVGGTVSCLDPNFTTGVVNCTGCVGSYVIPPTCLLCSPPSSPAIQCNTCPQGSYGGPEAELSCQLCPYRFTTIYPPSALSESACVPITEPPTSTPTSRPTQLPTQVPTETPTLRPTLPGETFPPTQPPTTGSPTTTPTGAPSIEPTTTPSMTPSQPPSAHPSEAPTTVPTTAPTVAPGPGELVPAPGTAGFNWSSVAWDATGTQAIATLADGGVYQSDDGGATWVEITSPTSPGNNTWVDSASSANGSVLAVAANDGDGNAGIWVSTDGGATWVQSQNGLPTGADWTSLAMSADGTKMQATDASGAVYTSTDGGNSWSSATSPPGTGWVAVDSSNNGSILIAAQDGGSVWLSFDGGNTWQQQNQTGDTPAVDAWSDVAASGDGSTCVAVASDGSVWVYDVATDTWFESLAAGTQDWSTVDISDDGNTILAGVDGGPLYISKDGGVTWYTDTSAGNQNWTDVAVSADGTSGLATTAPGSIYQWSPDTKAPTTVPTTAPTTVCACVRAHVGDADPLGVLRRSGTCTTTPNSSVTGTCRSPARRTGTFMAPTCCPVSPTSAPTSVFPKLRDLTITSLNTDIPPPSDVWNSESGSYNSLQSISAAPPANTTCALQQKTLADPSKATTGIYWNSGMFNGMLFKDFVLGSFDLSYSYYVESTPAGRELVYAPDIRIQTMSPGTGRYSDFVWNPYNNVDSQGLMVYQMWKNNTISQTTGSDANWPAGSTGGTGWSCTMGCFFPVNATEAHNLTSPASVANSTFRSLETYVNGLLNQAQCSEPSCAINDAIITGIQVVLGPDEPTSVAYTQKVMVSSGAYSWSWTFGCGGGAGARQLREEGRNWWPR